LCFLETEDLQKADESQEQQRAHYRAKNHKQENDSAAVAIDEVRAQATPEG